MQTDREIDRRVNRARSFRGNPTDAERKLWQHLRALKPLGAHFRRQATIGPYFADFACHTRKIVIELDGGQHTIERDHARTRYLERAGYRVMRFWNNDVRSNVDGIMQVIAAALDHLPPTPDPSPPLRGGRGAQYTTPRDNSAKNTASFSPPPACGGEGSGVGGNRAARHSRSNQADD